MVLGRREAGKAVDLDWQGYHRPSMTDLSSIKRLARVGATDRAWAALVSAGLDRTGGDERVLTLKGRLLKDRAMALVGADERHERDDLLQAAADAYAAAAALTGDSYPRINAAALAHLRGDRAAAAAQATDLLRLIDAGQHGGETPYWLEATRAEALLLSGRIGEAEDSLAKAVALAPKAREDRAITLRQFRRLLKSEGADSSWLARFALPPVMHFRGPMAVSSEAGAREVAAAVADILPGVAIGALAAGTDIIAAEAAVAQGADLHVVLPSGIEAFREGSVLPFNADWNQRFEALLEQAASIECMEEEGGLTDASVRMADDMAMGLAGIEAQAADDVPILLRARWQGADAVPNLGAPHQQVLVDLPRPAAMPHCALPSPVEPVVAVARAGEALVETRSLDQLIELRDQLVPGDCIDVVVAGALPLDPSPPRIEAMQRLDNGLTVLASRPAALMLWAYCPGSRPVLAGSATATTGAFEVYDMLV
jgi:hypothetical protein